MEENLVSKTRQRRAVNLNLWSWLIAVVAFIGMLENVIAGIGLATLSIILSLIARSDDKDTSPAALIFAILIIVFAFLIGSVIPT